MKLNIIAMSLCVSMLSACQSSLKPPSYVNEADLVANAFDQGLSQEIDLDYKRAYFQLKQAYQYCIAYTQENAMIFTDNRFEPDLEMGTLFARTGDGHYLYKMLVEGLRNGKTQLTLFLPKQHRAAQARFQQDVRWALGQDPKCNHSAVIIKD